MDDKPFDDEPFDAGVEADEQSDPEKFIQQLSGKLGQSLRKYTDERGNPDFDLEKFAINSLISATHTSEMDQEDQEDIIDKIKSSGAIDGHEHDDGEETYDHTHDADGDGIENEEGDYEIEEPEGGEVEETYSIVNDVNLDKEKETRKLTTNEDIDPHQPLDDDATMDLINKYNPTLVKIGKNYGKDSDFYNRFSDAMSRNDEPFLKKLMKDGGILFESIKKDNINLDNSEKNITFVNKFKNKLKEHHDMTYTDYLNVDNQEYVKNNEESPVETPVITPTETPTRTPRRNKPFKVPTIKPGTEPRPKASN